jgi:hypothetical protein
VIPPPPVPFQESRGTIHQFSLLTYDLETLIPFIAPLPLLGLRGTDESRITACRSHTIGLGQIGPNAATVDQCNTSFQEITPQTFVMLEILSKYFQLAQKTIC